LRQLRHQRLPRKLVSAEQVAQALRLIGGRGEDCGAHRALLGFADEETAEQIAESVKDLGPHQRAKLRDERNEFEW